jgi:uncharacterized protein (TIGR00288 family)
MSEEPLIAVFVDFENLALGVRDMKAGKFQIQLVLKRLLEKGRIVYKRAYCDWRHYEDAVREFHGQGVELIDIPQTKVSGKNSADIRMVVDAMDLCYSKQHIDTFALLSGDSDFSPLVSKLKENHRRVIGCGVKSSTSDLLIANCDEFIYYDDLVRKEEQRRGRRKAPAKQASGKQASTAGGSAAPAAAPTSAAVPEPFPAPASAAEPPPTDSSPAAPHAAKSEEEKKQEAFDLVLATIEALAEDREEDEKIWGSMIKQALKRQRPGFNETYHGFKSFSQLLEEAQARRLIELEKDEKSGGYVVKAVA